MHYEIVNAILNIWVFILLTREKPLVVCFVFSEEQRYRAFAGKDEFTQFCM